MLVYGTRLAGILCDASFGKVRATTMPASCRPCHELFPSFLSGSLSRSYGSFLPYKMIILTIPALSTNSSFDGSIWLEWTLADVYVGRQQDRGLISEVRIPFLFALNPVLIVSCPAIVCILACNHSTPPHFLSSENDVSSPVHSTTIQPSRVSFHLCWTQISLSHSVDQLYFFQTDDFLESMRLIHLAFY